MIDENIVQISAAYNTSGLIIARTVLAEENINYQKEANDIVSWLYSTTPTKTMHFIEDLLQRVVFAPNVPISEVPPSDVSNVINATDISDVVDLFGHELKKTKDGKLFEFATDSGIIQIPVDVLTKYIKPKTEVSNSIVKPGSEPPW